MDWIHVTVDTWPLRAQSAVKSLSALLQEHLRDNHSLQIYDWNPSRDKMPGSEESCRHCGAVFQRNDALRHIMTARCPHFDAAAPHVTMDRLALTLKCQLCSESYTRQIHLAHLQGAHSDLWFKALPTTRFFLSLLMPELGSPSPNWIDFWIRYRIIRWQVVVSNVLLIVNSYCMYDYQIDSLVLLGTTTTDVLLCIIISNYKYWLGSDGFVWK